MTTVKVLKISYQPSTRNYLVLLKDVDGDDCIPLIIGSFEAQSIAIGLEKEINPPRPITHDLMYNCFVRYGITVKQIIIHKLVDGVFYSSLICVRDKIEEIIDARTSDAVALSIRFNSPIFTYENILKKAGFTNEKSGQGNGNKDDQWIKNFIKEQTSNEEERDFSKIALKDLKTLLKKFVKEEDYEAAAKVRDELSKRKED